MPLENKKNNTERLASDIAKEHGLPPRLVLSIIEIESNWNPYAVRYEPEFHWTLNIDVLARSNHVTSETMAFMQKTSWGLMQVMGAVAYEHELQKEQNPHERTPNALVNPWLGIVYGCRHLKLKSDLYGPEPADIYAAYNAGSVRYKNDGSLINQANVDRFMKVYDR